MMAISRSTSRPISLGLIRIVGSIPDAYLIGKHWIIIESEGGIGFRDAVYRVGLFTMRSGPATRAALRVSVEVSLWLDAAGRLSSIQPGDRQPHRSHLSATVPAPTATALRWPSTRQAICLETLHNRRRTSFDLTGDR